MTAEAQSISGVSRPHGRALTVCAIFVTVTYLSFARLDNTPFWDDEAHVGIIARNYLATGTFTGWDGRNLLGYRNGQMLDQDLKYINPPLDCLVAAASFRLFGQNTWAGRFPFVIAGLISLAVFGVIVHRDFRDQPALWLYALAGVGLSVVFLLNIRQCRYYSLGLLTALLSYDVYRRCLMHARLVHYLVFAGAMVAMFYSNFLYCAAFAGTLAVVHLTFRRREVKRKDLWKVGLAVACIALATVPYAIQHRIWHRPDIQQDEPWMLRKSTLLWWNLRELNVLGLPWMVAVLLAVIFVLTWRRDKNLGRVLEYVFLGIGYPVFVALLSPQPVGTSVRVADVRYLLPAVPFLAVLVAAALRTVHQRDSRLAAALFIVVVATNTFSFHPWGWESRWLLPAYVNEVHHEYPTAYAEVVDYLRKNAQKDEVVFGWPEFTNYPILFYLGDHLRIGCVLSEQNPLPMDKVEKLESTGAPLLFERHYPDWLVFFGPHPTSAEILEFFSRPHVRGNEVVQMSYNRAALLDVYFQATSRPELHLHSFGPERQFDPLAWGVHILKGTLIPAMASPRATTAPAR